MRRASALLLFAMVTALASTPGVTAGINPDRSFSGEVDFAPDIESADVLLSGETSAEVVDTDRSAIWLDVQPIEISGVTRVCWEPESSNVAECHNGALTIRVQARSSVAFGSSFPYDLLFEADHSLTFFADLDAIVGEQEEDIAFGPSFMAVPVEGRTFVSGLGTIPTTATSYTSFEQARGEMAMLFTLSDTTRVTILEGSSVIEHIDGIDRYLGFQGTPVVGLVDAAVVGLPFPEGGTMEVVPAGADAAGEGLDPDHITSAVSSIEGSIGSEEDAGGDEELGAVSDSLGTLEGVLNGALLGLDADSDSVQELLGGLTLVRFDALSATSQGDQVMVAATGPLVVEEASVKGADGLIFIFPWWSFALWALAIGLFVLRLAMKCPAKHETWGHLWWIGVVGGFVASIFAFWIWDTEVKSIWGISLLSGGLSADAFLFLMFVEVLPLLLAGLTIGIPVRIILQSSFRLGKLGSFMRLGAVVAPFVTVLVGALLMLDYLDALLDALSA